MGPFPVLDVLLLSQTRLVKSIDLGHGSGYDEQVTSLLYCGTGQRDHDEIPTSVRLLVVIVKTHFHLVPRPALYLKLDKRQGGCAYILIRTISH